MEEDEEYVVCSALRVLPFVKSTIEAIIQKRSRIEANANMISTTMLLRWYESGKPFTEMSVKQSMINACARAVCSRDGSRPEPVEFKDAEVQLALREAQEILIPTMTNFDNDAGLAQTINQSSLSYITVFTNNIFMRIESWQMRTLRAELLVKNSPHTNVGKPLLNFICRDAARAINLAKRLDPTSYKSEDIKTYDIQSDAFVQGIILRHQQAFSHARTQPGIDVANLDYLKGICTPELIKRNLHLYLAYSIYLQRQVGLLEESVIQKDGLVRRPKYPFQVIPQLTMKLRCVTFGKEQISELITMLAKDQTLFEGETVASHVSSLFLDVQPPSVSERCDTALTKKRLEIDHLIQNQEKRIQQLKEIGKPRTAKQLVADDKKTASIIQKIKLKQEKLRIEELKQEKRLETGSKKRKKVLDDNQYMKKSKPNNASEWKAISDIVTERLFLVPGNILKKWNGVVTTDGIRANWHCKRKKHIVQKPEKIKARGKAKDKAKIKACTLLLPKHYGTHKEDVVFPLSLGNFNIIAVDPGHVDLISAVRLHQTEKSLEHLKPLKPVGRKKSKIQAIYEKQHRSRFKLSNREWSKNCGRLANRSRHLDLSKTLGLQGSVDLLASSSSRTGFSVIYLKHAYTRIETAPKRKELMEVTCNRRWEFQSYQKEQRAVEKLSTDLLGGLSPSETLIVWGNGGFGPTSKGHESAPNKKMQKALARRVPLVIGSEYRSTQTSCCHHCNVKALKHEGQNTRAVVVQCESCKTLIGRDVNAAAVIADIFTAVRFTDETRPDWITDDTMRVNNKSFGATCL